MQVSLPNWTVKSMSKLMPKMEKFVDPARYNAKKLARYKHDWLAIKHSKFKKSRRKSTVTNKTSNTKRYKNILSHSIASKQTTWYKKVIKIYVNKKIKHKIKWRGGKRGKRSHRQQKRVVKQKPTIQVIGSHQLKKPSRWLWTSLQHGWRDRTLNTSMVNNIFL